MGMLYFRAPLNKKGFRVLSILCLNRARGNPFLFKSYCYINDTMRMYLFSELTIKISSHRVF